MANSLTTTRVYRGGKLVADPAPSGMTSRPPLSPNLFLGLAVLILLLGFAVPSLATFLDCALVFVIVWLARVEYLPALILTQISRADIALEGIIPEARESSTVILGGLPFNANYVLSFALVVRITWEIYYRPETFRPVVWYLVLWYLAMFPAMAMTLMNKAAAAPSWTLSIRTIWACGALFYGYILARSWGQNVSVMIRQLMPVVIFIMVLFATGALLHKLLYYVIPAGFPLARAVWLQGGKKQRIYALVCAFLTVMLGFGFQIWSPPVEEAPLGEQRMGLGDASLTSNALMFGSALLTLVLMYGTVGRRRAVRRKLGLPAFVVVLAFTFGVAIIGPYFWSTTSQSVENMTHLERMRAKLFDDRSKIWNATLVDIVSPPLFVKPKSGTVWINDVRYGLIEWTAGCHNSILSALCFERWFTGLTIIVLLAFGMHRNAQMFGISAVPYLEIFCITTAVTAVVGVIVNDYPLGDEGACWFFCFAGIVGAFSESSRNGRERRSLADE